MKVIRDGKEESDRARRSIKGSPGLSLEVFQSLPTRALSRGKQYSLEGSCYSGKRHFSIYYGLILHDVQNRAVACSQLLKLFQLLGRGLTSHNGRCQPHLLKPR